MGSHLPLVMMNPDLQVPSGPVPTSIAGAAVGVRSEDVGRVGSAAQAAVATRAQARARRVIPGITGSIKEERYGAPAV
jgi:hypothetical protein